jgi:hypothetical protein
MTIRIVGLIFFLVSCAVAKAAAPSGPGGIRVTEALAPGDTLAYTVSWTAGARAVSYDFTVSVAATNGVWSAIFGSTAAGALPATGNTTALTFSPKLLAIPWDSATFTVTVVSRNAAGVSGPASATWTVRRKPGPPGPPKVDSTLTVTGMLTVPPNTQLAVGQTRDVCAFQQFMTGAITAYTADRARCDSLYQQVPLVARQLVTPAQQAHTDATVACVTWSGGLPFVSLTALPCASVVRVTALQATGLSPFWTPWTDVRLAAR